MSYLGNSPEKDIVINKKEYIATEGQTSFGVVYDDYVEVYLNGVRLSDSDYTALTGANIVLAIPATAGDIIQCSGFQSVTFLDAVKVDGVNGAAQIPYGSTAQRPTSPDNGYLRYNTDLLMMESYSNGEWGGVGGDPDFPMVNNLVPTGETVSIPAGRTLVHPNLQVDGTLAVDGTLFIPSGGTYNASAIEVDTGLFSGNVGIGITPSPWSIGKVLELGYLGNGLWCDQVNELFMTSNSYYNSGFKYGSDGYATQYKHFNGTHQWRTAPSGITGSPIIWANSMILDANGNLGINTTTPTSGKLVSRASGNSYNGQASFVAEDYTGTTRTYISQISGKLFISNGGGVDHVILDTDGSLKLNQGLKLSNTAIADATALDWYEEGTFTPRIDGATSAGVGTYGAQVGKYTRVGNRVDVSLQLTWSAHTGTGFMKIAGFPFNFANTHGFICSGYNLTITGQLYMEIGTGSSIGLLYALNNGTASQLAMDTSATVICNFTYFA